MKLNHTLAVVAAMALSMLWLTDQALASSGSPGGAGSGTATRSNPMSEVFLGYVVVPPYGIVPGYLIEDGRPELLPNGPGFWRGVP
jgi:hypothetical protein